jgi:hypothetical protein
MSAVRCPLLLAKYFLSQHSDKGQLYLRITGAWWVLTNLEIFPLTSQMYFSKLGTNITLISFTHGSGNQPCYGRMLAFPYDVILKPAKFLITTDIINLI